MNRNHLLATAAAVGLLVVLFWLFTTDTQVVDSTVVKELSVAPVVKKRVQIKASSLDEDRFLPLDEDPTIDVVTPKCRELVENERRGVLQVNLMDMVRDRGMRFTEQDLTCLTAGGASPAILSYAEDHEDYNKQQGIRGNPGRNTTREHHLDLLKER